MRGIGEDWHDLIGWWFREDESVIDLFFRASFCCIWLTSGWALEGFWSSLVLSILWALLFVFLRYPAIFQLPSSLPWLNLRSVIPRVLQTDVCLNGEYLIPSRVDAGKLLCKIPQIYELLDYGIQLQVSHPVFPTPSGYHSFISFGIKRSSYLCLSVPVLSVHSLPDFSPPNQGRVLSDRAYPIATFSISIKRIKL